MKVVSPRRPLLATLSVLVFASAPLLSKAASVSDYTAQASRSVTVLMNNWYNVQTGIWDTAWWNSANALTTLADFALLNVAEANTLNVGGIMYNTYVNAQKTQVQTTKVTSADMMPASVDCLDSGNGCMSLPPGLLRKRGFDNFTNEFYDDEGWWALALIHAWDVTGTREYIDEAAGIFEDMKTGGNTNCNGGIYWSKDRTYVNAIANELYLSVAAALSNRMSNKDYYLATATAQWQWFRDSGMINADHLINDGLDGNCKNNGMQMWTYNQGVVLGGLVELSRATGDASLLDTAVEIANAALKAKTVDGILVEGCEKTGDTGCGRDGSQFKGIFVRNLRYLYDARPLDNFRTFITDNADSIWAHDRGDGDKLGSSWAGPANTPGGPNGMSHSAAMDVLVAAMDVAGR